MTSARLRRRLAFLHVPKCGGTSFDAALRALLEPAPGRPPAWARFDPPAHAAAAAALDVAPARLAEYWLCYHLAQPRLWYVSGHLHHSPAAQRAFGDQWDFLTLLRQPVDRWFSHYFYNRDKAAGPYRIAQPLAEFVATPRAVRIANATLLYFGGGQLDAIVADPRAAAARAIAVLDGFALVGCLERRDDLQRRFAARYGVALSLPHLQRNPLPPEAQAAEITPALRRRVEALCAADREVYDHFLARCAGPGT